MLLRLLPPLPAIRPLLPQPDVTTVPISEAQSGDLIFAHSKGAIGGAIRLIEKLRRDWAKTNEASGARYNHVAILDTPLPNGDWSVIQAVGKGVIEDTLERPSRLSTVTPGGFYSIVQLPKWTDREDVLAFARAQVGSRYGFVTCASILVTLFTPKFLNVMLPNTWICSAVGAEAVRTGGWVHCWPDLYSVTPAALWLALEAS